jgi:hypothetical protein
MTSIRDETSPGIARKAEKQTLYVTMEYGFSRPFRDFSTLSKFTQARCPGLLSRRPEGTAMLPYLDQLLFT